MGRILTWPIVPSSLSVTFVLRYPWPVLFLIYFLNILFLLTYSQPFRCATTLRRHLGKCELRAPPGIEIYTDSPNNDEYTIAVYEIGTVFMYNLAR